MENNNSKVNNNANQQSSQVSYIPAIQKPQLSPRSTISNMNLQSILYQQELLKHQNNEPSFDLKQFRLVATDFLMSPILQNLFAKVRLKGPSPKISVCFQLWKLMISYNYEKEQIKQHQEHLLQIPLRMDIYAHFEPIFYRGLGALYQTSQFICSRSNNYPHDYVLFQRFCFDFISLSGQYIYQLTLSQYEYLFRKVFALITYYDTSRQELCFRQVEDIGMLHPNHGEMTVKSAQGDGTGRGSATANLIT